MICEIALKVFAIIMVNIMLVLSAFTMYLLLLLI